MASADNLHSSHPSKESSNESNEVESNDMHIGSFADELALFESSGWEQNFASSIAKEHWNTPKKFSRKVLMPFHASPIPVIASSSLITGEYSHLHLHLTA